MAARAVHSNNHLVDEDSGGCGSGGGGLIAKANEHGRAAGADGGQIGLRLPTWGDRPTATAAAAAEEEEEEAE